MQEFKKQNIVLDWFYWHFFEMPKFLFLVWKNYILFFLDYFSIPLLLMTLFSPWRKNKDSYSGGFDIGKFFSSFIYNVFSRLIGMFLRLILIVIGIMAQIFVIIFGVFIIIVWVLMPFVLIGVVLFIFVI